MSLRQSIAANDEPTPEPGSAIVKSSPDDRLMHALAAALGEARILYGSETSDAWFAALEDGTHPLCRIATPGCNDERPRLTDADLVTDPAMLASAERYAGDVTHDRELEDLRAGRHPLQHLLVP